MTEIEARIASSLVALLEKHPIQQITVAEICALAGVSKRSFYNYFCDKYEVIHRVQAIPESQDEGAEVSVATLENYFRSRYRWLLEHRGFLKNLSDYSGQNSFVAAFRDSVADLLWKIMLKNSPGLQRSSELICAVNGYAFGLTVFVIEMIQTDPDACEAYFGRERFLMDSIPPILKRYITD